MTVTPQDDSDFSSTDEVEVEQTTEVSEAEGESAELTNDEVEDDGAGDEVVSEEQDVEDTSERVTVVVDGAEVEVTLDELRKSYLRQSDYTRKTQEVAAERKRLANLAQLEQWLESDPVGTIQALQKAFGAESAEADEVELDPIEERLNKHEAFIARQEAAAREAQIVGEANAALAGAQLTEAKYEHNGVVLTGPEALLQFAVNNQIGNLQVAARLLKSEQPAPKVTPSRVATTERKRAAAVVEGGRTKAPATTAPAKPKRMSLHEAYEAAKAAQKSA